MRFSSSKILQLSVHNMLQDSLQKYPELDFSQKVLAPRPSHYSKLALEDVIIKFLLVSNSLSPMSSVSSKRHKCPKWQKSHDHGIRFPSNAAEILGTSRTIATSSSQDRQEGFTSHRVQGRYGSANSGMLKFLLFKVPGLGPFVTSDTGS